jgi:hypothetical protein
VAKGAWVSLLVLAETIWVLDAVYQIGHAEIATALEMLLAHEVFERDEPSALVERGEAFFKLLPHSNQGIVRRRIRTESASSGNSSGFTGNHADSLTSHTISFFKDCTAY